MNSLNNLLEIYPEINPKITNKKIEVEINFPRNLGCENPNKQEIKIVIITKNNWIPVPVKAQKIYRFFGGKNTLPATCFHPDSSNLLVMEF